MTLIANPWVVTPRLTWTPIEPIFRATPSNALEPGASPAVHTPVRPSITRAATPVAPSVSIISRSIRLT